MPVRAGADACPGVFAPHDAADGALARIRLPGGVIGAAALRVVADCAQDLGDGRVHLTSRGNLQLRGLSRSGALAARLADAGLLPSATHERVRNVLASPLAGIATWCRTRGCPRSRRRASGTAGPDHATSAGSPRPWTAGCARGRAGRAAGAVPVRARRRAGRRRGGGPGPVLAGAGTGCWWPGWTPGCGSPAAEAVARCWTRRRRSSRCGRRTAGRRGGRRSWPTHRPGSPPARSAAPRCRKATFMHVTPCKVAFLHRTGRGRPGPVRRDDGGLALVVAPLLGELTADQVRLLADAGRRRRPSSRPGARVVAARAPQSPPRSWPPPGCSSSRVPAADVSACAGRPGCAKALADVRADALAAPRPASRGGRRARLRLRTALRSAPAPRTSTPSRSPGAGTSSTASPARDWRRDAQLRPRRRRDLPPLVRHHPRRGRPHRPARRTSPRSRSG